MARSLNLVLSNILTRSLLLALSDVVARSALMVPLRRCGSLPFNGALLQDGSLRLYGALDQPGSLGLFVYGSRFPAVKVSALTPDEKPRIFLQYFVDELFDFRSDGANGWMARERFPAFLQSRVGVTWHDFGSLTDTLCRSAAVHRDDKDGSNCFENHVRLFLLLNLNARYGVFLGALMIRSLALVLSDQMARSIILVLSTNLARSRTMVLSNVVARSDNLVLSWCLARSQRLVHSMDLACGGAM